MDAHMYWVSAFCLVRRRPGFFHTRHGEAGGDSIPDVLETAPIPPIVETSLAAGVLRDLREGARYLREQPRVLALGITYATMLAGVISGKALIAALGENSLDSRAGTYRFVQTAWAVGAAR